MSLLWCLAGRDGQIGHKRLHSHRHP